MPGLVPTKRIMLRIAIATALLGSLCQFCPVTAQEQPATPAAAPSVWVHRAPNDQQDYRYLRLANGLSVLLISAPDSDLAAASLQVAVGSSDDPAERPGLTHFLEHMLFLGTDRYPAADDYTQFIASRGGRYNAYTAFEYTNYFFQLPAPHLEPILDRFARFFIAPRFDPRYVERELNAVEAEFQAGLEDDRRRQLDVFKDRANPDHPWAKFAVGNRQTLFKQGLREDLLAFYSRHYLAGNMSLAVLGRESLDELQAMVEKKFAEVPAGGSGRRPIEKSLFPPTALPYLVHVEPRRELRELSLSFPVPDAVSHFRNKPLYYLSQLIGHEGTGSLLSLLKARDWATGLVAGGGLRYRGGGTLDIDITLTERGVAEVEKVAAAVFGYIAELRRNGIESWRFGENQRLAELDFRFREQPVPLAQVSAASNNMHLYPPAEILRGDYLHEHFDAALIRRFLANLRPENCFMMLLAKGGKPTHYSRWYRTPYAIRELAVKPLHSWPAGTASGMQLPERNRFIPQQLSVLPSPPKAALAPPELPRLVHSGKSLRLWHRDNGKFPLPKADIRVRLQFPFNIASPAAEAQTVLLAVLLKDSLAEATYPALLAGIDYKIFADNRGLQFVISGYSDRQEELLLLILRGLQNFAPELSRFEAIRQEQSLALRDIRQGPPFHVLSVRLGQILSATQWDEQEVATAMNGVDLESLRAFARRVTAEMSVMMLMVGNYSADDAQRIARRVESFLPRQPPAAKIPPVLALGRGSAPMLWLEALPDPDTAVILYLQAEHENMGERAMMGLVAQLLRSDFFHQLRTERQLGYIVSNRPLPFRNTGGITFGVQSPTSDVAVLRNEISNFLQRADADLEKMSEQDFVQYRQALLDQLEQRAKNRGELTSRWWGELGLGNERFSLRKELAQAVGSVTLPALRAFFKQHFLDARERRMLWLVAPGKDADAAVLAKEALTRLEAAGGRPGNEVLSAWGASKPADAGHKKR